MTAFVMYSYDIDCDGFCEIFHYFEGSEGTTDEFREYGTQKGFTEYEIDLCVDTRREIMPLTTFFSRAINQNWWKGFNRNYFLEEGYHHNFVSRWND